ncbi:MAG: winged helix-turn-helix domain-containing protein [Desulfuromonadales bacterium]|nr:winged helix-turn-helix domain-containing protein [Desulfuromonadales bacterium]
MKLGLAQVAELLRDYLQQAGFMVRIVSNGRDGIYSRQQLMDRIYPDQRSVSDRTIDSHIKKLRRKPLTISAGSELIRSVYGVAYTFDA